ncbi:MAG: cytochrome c oxidase subunit II transmembrane domain-containing protein, partial [Pseudomonadota bacterium]
MRIVTFALMAALTSLFLFGAASAQTASSDGAVSASSELQDLPIDKGINLREAASPMAEEIDVFHDFVILPVMVGISLLILALLVWVAIRYNSKSNPVPSRFSHNTTVEVVWTLIPVLILLFIALFSFDLLYMQDKMPDGQVYEYESGVKAVRFPNDFSERRKVKDSNHIEVALIEISSDTETLLSADEYSVGHMVPAASGRDEIVPGFGNGEQDLAVQLVSAVPDGYKLRVTAGRSRVGRKPFLGLFGKDESQIIPAPSVTIKATGFQWGWTYNYPDYGDFQFDSLIAPRDSVPSELYRFATTNDVVVPAGETVRIVTT